ncbi:hypothetical protein GCM10011583_54740 [Streptomyces camponoticapitis]|uniref:Uncharacterized protein n=1 Tax=Streptomyces camponoticapitis TaxID=1616125 RepID=A0ABQ2EP38_9ACTN|nr:DUF6002 family protein [Streptomyces camponoticapitis]GGK15910.1 hypothetical protein GCM10011583_54740 [Streptomyces camponoticapitis]
MTTALVAERNLILDYYERLPQAVAALVDDPAPVTGPGAFSPGFALPEPDAAVRGFFEPARAQWRELGTYAGHRLVLLDLAGNPGTHTTKTFPSLLIVARAVEYIRRTGETVMIFTPTSANKGTALRDAVARALAAGLATPDQLRIATLAPASGRSKLRAGSLTDDAELRARNPLMVYDGERAEDVKALARQFTDAYAADLKRRHGVNLWFSLDLRNYLVADTARAFFEQDVDPTDAAGPRLHAHAVSSAFGLLGYHAGRDVLEAAGAARAASRPASLLVQHLGTPDMVLSLRRGSFDRTGLPGYDRDGDGLWRQKADPHFPGVADEVDEILDPTFYTHRPATSPAMNAIIARHGGDGIVVSRRECLERYPELRELLADHPRPLPDDPRALREWSLVMALTGVCNAVDRGLVDPGRDVVVHGSGWYTDDDVRTPAESALVPVSTVEDITAALM